MPAELLTLVHGNRAPAYREAAEVVRRSGSALLYAAFVPDRRDRARIAGGPDGARLRQLTEPRVREQFVGSRVLLRGLLGALLGGPGRTIGIEAGEHGRPYLPGVPELDLNLSHTSGPAGPGYVIGLARAARIGVDIEPAGRDLLAHRVAGQLCCPAELDRLATLDRTQAVAFVNQLWTLKEAVAKALGLGLGLDLRTLRFDLSGRHPELTQVGGGRWSVRSWLLAPGFRVAAALLVAGEGR